MSPRPLSHELTSFSGLADIKAENFLYKTRESEVDDFQLIDFGISKVRPVAFSLVRSAPS